MVAKLNSIVSKRGSLFRTSSISWYWALFVALVALLATKSGTKPEVIVFDYFFGHEAREIRARAASAQIYPSPSKHGCVCCRLSNAITDGICRACHHLQGYGRRERIDDIEAQLSGGGGGPSRQLEERGREGEREESAPSPVRGGRENSSSYSKLAGLRSTYGTGSGSASESTPGCAAGSGVESSTGSRKGGQKPRSKSPTKGQTKHD